MVQKVKINVKERFSDGEVDLSMSDLEEVPVKEIAALKKTTSLDLSNNRITFLPSNFIVLTNLTKLDLSKNELTELPEDFGSLSKLRHLDLYKNNLERLPLSFRQLNSLKFLDLKDNPLIPAIAKVAGPCVDTKGCQQCARNVVNFYRQLQEEIDNEVEMRKKSRQKQLEINQQKKQEEKKKLKKEKQNNKPKNEAEKNDNKKSAHLVKKQSKKDQKRNKHEVSGTWLSSFIKLCFGMLIISVLVDLYLNNFKYSTFSHLILHIKDQYKVLLTKLPIGCRYYVEIVEDTLCYLQESTRNVTLSCIKTVNDNEVIQGIVLKVKDGISNLIETVAGRKG